MTTAEQARAKQLQQQIGNELATTAVNWQQVLALLGTLLTLLLGGQSEQQLISAAPQDCCCHLKHAICLDARALCELTNCCCKMDEKGLK